MECLSCSIEIVSIPAWIPPRRTIALTRSQDLWELLNFPAVPGEQIKNRGIVGQDVFNEQLGLGNTGGLMIGSFFVRKNPR
jgi:hypothetical protein